jgi:hypothetical protein
MYGTSRAPCAPEPNPTILTVKLCDRQATIRVLKHYFSSHYIVRLRLARVLYACLLCALPASPIVAHLQRPLARGGQLRNENLLISQRPAARPHQRALPRGRGWHVRSPRGALRPRARLDTRCSLTSPLGEPFCPKIIVNRNAGAGSSWVEAQLKKVSARIPPFCLAALVLNSEPLIGARSFLRVCI